MKWPYENCFKHLQNRLFSPKVPGTHQAKWQQTIKNGRYPSNGRILFCKFWAISVTICILEVTVSPEVAPNSVSA